ncbi:hypothetical protein M0802_003272 [Mischocyttarus mexicanus]|nr:hypothetical protein M0802_003272 [Mischocyttarus mexicanus]
MVNGDHWRTLGIANRESPDGLVRLSKGEIPTDNSNEQMDTSADELAVLTIDKNSRDLGNLPDTMLVECSE